MSTESNKAYFERQSIEANEKYMHANGEGDKTPTPEEAGKIRTDVDTKIFRERLLMLGLFGVITFIIIKL